MEDGQAQKRKSRQRRKQCIVLIFVAVVLVVLAIVLWLVLRTSEHEEFKRVFTSRCDAYGGGYDCAKTWSAFEQAYVGKDPCFVPPESYQALIEAAPIKPDCNRMMFWSKTKDVVHDFTSKKECFITMEDTFVGSVLDGLTWCSKVGSKETFTSGCPGWSDCVNNTVRSFWSKASASFAQVACGKVSVMLNGSIATPFSPASIFASIEVKNFNPDNMKSLEVVLVTQDKEVSNCANPSLQDLQKELAQGISYSCSEVPESNCANPSLQDLQKELAQGISYSCSEVPESQIEECASDPEKPCGSCW